MHLEMDTWDYEIFFRMLRMAFSRIGSAGIFVAQSVDY
jgi:hypothetical protein